MSRKVSIFRVANIAPQPTCNYVVWIPKIFTSPVVVEATSIPFGEIESKTIPIRGLQYSIPVKRKAQGSWSCTLAENILLTSLYQSLFKQHLELSFNNIMNTLVSVEYKDIYIFITDGVSGIAPISMCVLKDCYLSKIEQIDLKASGATEAMSVKLTFQYNDIDDTISFIQGVDPSLLTSQAGLAAIEAAVIGMTAAGAGTAYATNLGIDTILDTLRK